MEKFKKHIKEYSLVYLSAAVFVATVVTELAIVRSYQDYLDGLEAKFVDGQDKALEILARSNDLNAIKNSLGL